MFIENVAEKIQELVQKIIDNPNIEYEILEIGKVNEYFAQRIEQATGFALLDYVFSIDNYSIKHVLKHHGDPENEAKMGQIGVTCEDFMQIATIISEADLIKEVGKSRIGNLGILFEKHTIGRIYFCIQEIRTVTSLKKLRKKKNRIMLQTLYIRKKPLK